MTWFRRIRNEFRKRADEFAGEPITYVEIGVWRGESSNWVCQNILTHPKSRGFGIDPYPTDRKRNDAIMDRTFNYARQRLSEYDKYSLIRKPSVAVLRRWKRPIDLLYIDGSHFGSDVLQDFCLAWGHLKVGSGVIFDDWTCSRARYAYPHVYHAVWSIAMAFSGLVSLWQKPGAQFGLKVVGFDPLHPSHASRRELIHCLSKMESPVETMTRYKYPIED